MKTIVAEILRHAQHLGSEAVTSYHAIVHALCHYSALIVHASMLYTCVIVYCLSAQLLLASFVSVISCQ